jgi:hypothetical protein
MIEPVDYKGGDDVPERHLRLRNEMPSDGLELIQFFLFLRDVSFWPYAGDKVQTF